MIIAPVGISLEEPDRRELLRIARVYGREWLRSGRRPPGTPHRPSLLARSGAWLRLRLPGGAERSALRLLDDRALYLALAELAIDLVGRPPPLSLPEVAAARLEALALGSTVRLTAAAEVVPGRHGLLLVGGGNGGWALLPPGETAVATNGEAALARLCRLAGLPEDGWTAEGVEVHAFDGVPFGDA